MNLDYELKHPKKYFLVTILLADGESIRGIAHSWHPHGAIRTVMSAPKTQAVIGSREVKDFIVEPLDEFESIQKDDFCVQTSKDGLYWIITNVQDNIVYKLSKAPSTAISFDTISFLDDEPLTAQEKHVYKRKLLIWFAKYGGGLTPDSLM
jgi:hypothetical protein